MFRITKLLTSVAVFDLAEPVRVVRGNSVPDVEASRVRVVWTVLSEQTYVELFGRIMDGNREYPSWHSAGEASLWILDLVDEF